MDIQIIESKTQRIIATYPVNAAGLNYVASDEDHYALAWRCAVDDCLVAEGDREAYEFRPLKAG